MCSFVSRDQGAVLLVRTVAVPMPVLPTIDSLLFEQCPAVPSCAKSTAGQRSARTSRIEEAIGSYERNGSGSFLRDVFGRDHLRLVYIGGGPPKLQYDNPRYWNDPWALDYYAKTAKELHRRHSVCYAPATEAQRSLRHCACLMPSPDAVIFGWTVWSAQAHRTQCALMPVWRKSRPPIIGIMNKEYDRVLQKQTLASHLPLDRVLTVVDRRQVDTWSKASGRQFVRWPFAADCDSFVARGLATNAEYEYDVGFTGVVRERQTRNWRAIILERLTQLAIEQCTQRGCLSVFRNIGVIGHTNEHNDSTFSTKMCSQALALTEKHNAS